MILPLLLGSTALVGGGVTIGTFTAMALRRVVPTNEVHIVQSGRKTTSYGKDRGEGNVYYQWPANLPALGVTVTVLPESVFSILEENYEAYDENKIPFLVDVMAFFRVVDSNMAAHRVAHFNDLEEQLRYIVRDAVRGVLGKMRLEQIMVERTQLGDDFTAAVQEQLGEWGVTTVKSVAFMDIRDVDGMDVIEKITSKDRSRIDMEARLAVAANSQAASTREIEAEQAIGLAQQQKAQQVGEREAQAAQAVGIAKQKSQQGVLDATLLTAEKDMAVKRLVEVQNAEIARAAALVLTDQEKQQQVIRAEADAQKTETLAKGTLAAAKLEAQGVQAKGEAEGRAIEAVKLAEIAPQISLAKEIGGNQGYQDYLIKNRGVEANERIGVAQAAALEKAQIKVIATGATAQSGLGGIGGLISPAAGAMLGGALEGLAATSATAARALNRANGDDRAA